MKRAAIAIGIRSYPNAPNLPTLEAAVGGAKSFAEWAQRNGCETKLVTDEEEPVTVDRVFTAVKDFVDRQGSDQFDQLILYFAGHGMNKGYSEYWLLSKAPLLTSEAINLPLSVNIARYQSWIPHVVFISDACRTAAESIGSQAVEGVSAFPNYERRSFRSTVDVFYASLPGAPSQEFKDAHEAASNYQALYTSCLLDILNGKAPRQAKTLDEDGKLYRVLTSRPLSLLLAARVPELAAKLRLKRGQDPDAIPVSDLPMYVARFEPAPSGVRRGARRGIRPEEPVLPRIVNAATLADLHVSNALPGLPTVGVEPSPAAAEFASQMRRLADAAVSGADQFKTGCGVSVLGTGVVAAASRRWEVNELQPRADGGADLRIAPGEGPAAEVLIELEGGRACLLPAFRGYIGTLTFQDGELVNVSYVPSRNSDYWYAYLENAERLNGIRSSIATAAYHGVLRLEPETARHLGNWWRSMKAVDPTLGIYASYAFGQVGAVDEIRDVAYHMEGFLGTVPFDVRMLVEPGASSGEAGSSSGEDYPPGCPVLAQGWALLGGSRIELPPELSEASAHRLPSLWTLFDAPALPMLQRFVTR